VLETATATTRINVPPSSEELVDLSLPMPEGKVSFHADELAPQAISPQNAFLMTDMMSDVVRRGTATRARALQRDDLAGKTGTTNDRRDAWFLGYTPDLVGAAWVGFDQERSLGPREEGGRTALPMWVYFMGEALRGSAQRRAAAPAGMVTMRISPDSGEPARPGDPEAIFETFIAGHVPQAGNASFESGNPGAAVPEDRGGDPLF
jgi:penicillin-binding protein 1A